MQQSPELQPSATVVLVRDAPGRLADDGTTEGGIETLLLQRHQDIRFAGGNWVFPGGKVENDELDCHADIELAEKHAAVRECAEEAGIELQASQLHKFSHWITPVAIPRRFSTGFYIVAIERNIAVEIDHGEIVNYQWLAPQEALAQQASGELPMMPPTFVSLCELAKMESAAGAVATFAEQQTKTFLPKIIPVESEQGAACILYQGDGGYTAGNPAAAGRQHRLIINASGYRYLCD